MADVYAYVQVVREARRRYRLVPVASNGARMPQAKTYVTRWNATRAARRFFPGVALRFADHHRP